ncbi:hypothetical protein [Clostridium hydrogeniformans]|uniref:hypothetical protein n=1 Tax=Clostridium hydrogeniformans TaxID=349933 RepID=UPI000557DE61|nr:hypothetical protein [Clostridium hydrogeniformans]
MVTFLQILTIIVIFLFIGLSIASFVILNKIFSQIKYKNYLMEKLTHNIYMLAKNSSSEDNKNN